MLQHEAHRVPVTALAFGDRYLFAGQGPFLRVHRRDNVDLLESYKVFDSQVVHGIVVADTIIVVWGGYQIHIFRRRLDGSDTLLEPFLDHPLSLQDWILDISISPYSQAHSQIAAVLTAHNALLLLDLDPAIASDERLIDLTATSRCILYSANLYWLEPNCILVASGTVFGEIILWSCNIKDKASAKSVLHQLLSGHDGSIFGVRIFESPIQGQSKRSAPLLASCSDDRTVRIWDISNLPETPLNPQAAADLSSARETGFGSNIADVLPDQTTAGHCVAQAWGHASRIWDVRFLPQIEGEVLTYFMSFGEDATTQLWALQPPSSTSSDTSREQRIVTNLSRTHVHSGKNIWSSAVTTNSHDKVTVATGGADGSIVLSNHDRPFKTVSEAIQSWSVDTILSNAPAQTIGKPDKLRGYAFVTSDSMIISTDSGNVFLLKTNPQTRHSTEQSKPVCKWISQEPKLRGYSVVAGLPHLGIAFLAGIDGTVLMFQANDMSSPRELTKCSGKTAALLARPLIPPRTHDQIGQHASVLVGNVESKHATLLHLSNASRPGRIEGFEVVGQWTVDLPSGFIVTSFLHLMNDHSGEKSSLILGSRNGCLACYTLMPSKTREQQTITRYDTITEEVHGRDAITDIAFVASQSPNSTGDHVISVGRDGTFVMLRITNSGITPSLQVVNQTSLPLGSLVEGVRIRDDDGSITCWGFYSKKFVVWDMISEKETMTVDCGGANRTWKFEPSSCLNGGMFAWTQASHLCLFTKEQCPPHIHDGGGHGREIKSIAVRPVVLEDGPVRAQVFATGSEDTNIKIFAYARDQSKNTTFRCLRTLRKHNTGIQNLQWSKNGQYLFSSGGFEEFFIWRIQPAPIISIGVVCESVCPTESDLPDLRIMNFSAQEVGSSGDETEISKFVISMVRSDSTLRVYSYTSSLDGGHWSLLSTGNYLTSCLTQCLDTKYRHGRTILTAGTDGHIAMWPMDHQDTDTNQAGAVMDPKPLRWMSRHSIHQSTIHCLLLYWLEEDKDCLLFTGSDDNAFAVTRCTWSDGAGKAPHLATIIAPRAHAAAITGLEIVQQTQSSSISIATTGLDQRVTIWRIDIDAAKPGVEGIHVNKVQTLFTPVADVSDIVLLDEQSQDIAVLVCGVGLDIWRYEANLA